MLPQPTWNRITSHNNSALNNIPTQFDHLYRLPIHLINFCPAVSMQPVFTSTHLTLLISVDLAVSHNSLRTPIIPHNNNNNMALLVEWLPLFHQTHLLLTSSSVIPFTNSVSQTTASEYLKAATKHLQWNSLIPMLPLLLHQQQYLTLH